MDAEPAVQFDEAAGEPKDSPLGSVSVKLTPVTADPLLLPIVIDNSDEPPDSIETGLNDLLKVSGVETETLKL